MPQILIPTIRFGKRKQRSQMCEVFTDDGRIATIELDVMKSCVDDPDKGIGFLLDADDQFMMEDRHWYQVLYEKSAIPICMIKGSDVVETQLSTVLNQIFDESQEAAKEHQYNIATKNAMMDKLIWIIAIVCSSAIILFAIQHFGAG